LNLKISSALKYIFLLLVGLAIFYYLFKTQYHSNFIEDYQKANKFWIAIATFCILVAHYFRAKRWQLMLDNLQEKRIPTFQVFNALMFGYLLNLVLPRAGEVARCAYLSKKSKLSTISLIGTVIAERVIDLMMLLVLVLIGFALYFGFILSFVETLNLYQSILQKLFSLVVLLIVLIIVGLILKKFWQKNNSIVVKIKDVFLKLKEGVLSVKKVKQPLLFILYTLLIWGLYLLSTYLAFKIINQTADLDIKAALLTLIAGSFGMVAPIQGGIGAYHFMVSQCLVLLGVNNTAGLVYATICHAAQTLMIIILGLVALIFSPSKALVKSNE
jgi:uncharacterized protein (TIRG00374 family)